MPKKLVQGVSNEETPLTSRDVANLKIKSRLQTSRTETYISSIVVDPRSKTELAFPSATFVLDQENYYCYS